MRFPSESSLKEYGGNDLLDFIKVSSSFIPTFLQVRFTSTGRTTTLEDFLYPSAGGDPRQTIGTSPPPFVVSVERSKRVLGPCTVESR